ncbi:hypothetical protein ACSBR2_039625 [Camellia fascicularis]
MWNGSGVFIKEGDCKEHCLHPKAYVIPKFNLLQLGDSISDSSGEESEHHHLLRWWLSLGFAILEALIFSCYSLSYSIYAASHRVNHVMVTSFLLVLVTLHQAVIPYLSNPIMLCDFLMRSYEIGGVISVMALSRLYVLMTQDGLEYPNFSEQTVTFSSSVRNVHYKKLRRMVMELLEIILEWWMVKPRTPVPNQKYLVKNQALNIST